MDTEPARIVGLITGAAAAILALVAYFVPLDPDLQKLILGVVGTIAPIVAGFYIRQYVTPVGKAQEQATGAYNAGVSHGGMRIAKRIVASNAVSQSKDS